MQCGAERTSVGQVAPEVPLQDHGFIQEGAAAVSCAPHRTELTRKRKREHRTVFNNEHLALNAQPARGWFIGAETTGHCAVSQGPFDWVCSSPQIHEL